jgi:hypothetical protein
MIPKGQAFDQRWMSDLNVVDPVVSSRLFVHASLLGIFQFSVLLIELNPCTLS